MVIMRDRHSLTEIEDTIENDIFIFLRDLKDYKPQNDEVLYDESLELLERIMDSIVTYNGKLDDSKKE